MSSFHNVRLPSNIELNAKGGPQFKTVVLELDSGYEKRNVAWAKARGQWDIGYAIQSVNDLEAVYSFFYARQGRAYGFRFKDWYDYQINTVQSIGNGDSLTTQFQTYKRYTSGGINYDRTLTRLVAATTKLYVNGATVSGTIDVNTGILTFSVAPSTGTTVGVTCEFDVPVRFDTDKLDVNMQLPDYGSVPSIPIVEIRE